MSGQEIARANMTHSYGLLTMQDVLTALRLVVQLAIAEDGSLRRELLTVGAVDLTNSHSALIAVVGVEGARLVFDPRTISSVGWTNATRMRAIMANGYGDSPLAECWLSHLASASWFVATREELARNMPRPSTRRLPLVDTTGEVGASLYAGCRLEPTERLLWLSVYRIGEDQRSFDPSDVQRIELLMEIAHRLSRLLDNVGAVMSDLRPRLKQTLEGLLVGKCEKEIAHDLGIRRATVHHYVGEIFQQFQVHSARELMAALLQRRQQ